MGPEEPDDTAWKDFRDYSNSKSGESQFQYQNETPDSIGSAIFPTLDDQDLPEKM